jgi:hypothetical protein
MDWTDPTLVALIVVILQGLKGIQWVADRTKILPVAAILLGIGLAALRMLCWTKVPVDLTVFLTGSLLGSTAIAAYSVAVKSIGPLLTKDGTPPAALVLIFLLPLLGGCIAPMAVREAQAWEVATWQSHLGNDQRIEQTWESVFIATRQADIDYTTQKTIDLVKMTAKTPADIEEGIKAVIAKRDKAMADTQLIVARMRSLVATNQNEAAKAMRVHGAVSQWMSVGMEASAIPNIVNEAFGLVQSLGLKVTMPGIQTPAISPEPATPTK